MNKRKIEYTTIKSTELKTIKIIIAFLIASNLILCFKGMALMQRNAELMKEKEALEEIVEVQKEVIDEK